VFDALMSTMPAKQRQQSPLPLHCQQYRHPRDASVVPIAVILNSQVRQLHRGCITARVTAKPRSTE
jgi:hypothetical protein